LAKLLTIKGKKPTKPIAKRIPKDAVESWGRNCDPKTCFTVTKTIDGFVLSSPLKIMAMPFNSMEYIIKVLFKLEVDAFLIELATKFNAEIKECRNFKFLIYRTETDARNCKNYLNKLLREV